MNGYIWMSCNKHNQCGIASIWQVIHLFKIRCFGALYTLLLDRIIKMCVASEQKRIECINYQIGPLGVFKANLVELYSGCQNSP